MSRSDEERIDDILRVADAVAEIVERGRDTLGRDPLAQPALERHLEVMGEAASRISEEFRTSHPDVPWSDVAGLRVLLAHAYHRVDPDQLWTIDSESVPLLVAALGSP